MSMRCANVPALASAASLRWAARAAASAFWIGVLAGAVAVCSALVFAQVVTGQLPVVSAESYLPPKICALDRSAGSNPTFAQYSPSKW